MPRSTGSGPGHRLAHTVRPGPGPAVPLPSPETWPIPIVRARGRTARAEAVCGTCGATLQYRLLSSGRTAALRVLWAVLFLVSALCFAATMHYFLMGPSDASDRPHSGLLFLGTLVAPALAYASGLRFRHETGLFGPGRWVSRKGHTLVPCPAERSAAIA